MYKDARKYKKAASGPDSRDVPFSMKDHYKGETMAKNDPVGREVYKSNVYAEDRAMNWIDRS